MLKSCIDRKKKESTLFSASGTPAFFFFPSRYKFSTDEFPFRLLLLGCALPLARCVLAFHLSNLQTLKSVTLLCLRYRRENAADASGKVGPKLVSENTKIYFYPDIRDI